MTDVAWLKRLGERLPGWFVWRSSRGWYAAPVKLPETSGERLAAYRHPYKAGPFRTPQELRAYALPRYGAGDHCQSCGGPWENCGHRQDETAVRA